MNASLHELRQSVGVNDEERRRLRENAAACVQEIRADLAEAEQLVATLSDGETIIKKPPRAKKTKPPTEEKPRVTKPVMIGTLREIIAENIPLTSEEVWDLAEVQLRDEYHRSGVRMIFDKTITETEFQVALRRPVAETAPIVT